MAERLTIEHYAGECISKCAQVVLSARIPRKGSPPAAAGERRLQGRWVSRLEGLGVVWEVVDDASDHRLLTALARSAYGAVIGRAARRGAAPPRGALAPRHVRANRMWWCAPRPRPTRARPAAARSSSWTCPRWRGWPSSWRPGGATSTNRSSSRCAARARGRAHAPLAVWPPRFITKKGSRATACSAVRLALKGTDRGWF